jgi:hypothetical protein
MEGNKTTIILKEEIKYNTPSPLRGYEKCGVM